MINYPLEPRKREKPEAVNLSKTTTAIKQIDIIINELKFTPTTRRSSYNEIKDDISVFRRKLQLQEESFEKNNDESFVGNRNNFSSPKSRNEVVSLWIYFLL